MLFVDIQQNIRDEVFGLIEAILVLTAEAKHQIVCRLLLLGALQKLRTTTPQTKFHSSFLCDVFHVCACTSEDAPHHSKNRVFLDTDDELALKLVARALSSSLP